MLDYITCSFFIVLILGDLIGIIKIVAGNYTSFFVRYFTVVSVDSKQLKKFSKDKQQKFSSLIALTDNLKALNSLLELEGKEPINTKIPLINWLEN